MIESQSFWQWCLSSKSRKCYLTQCYQHHCHLHHHCCLKSFPKIYHSKDERTRTRLRTWVRVRVRVRSRLRVRSTLYHSMTKQALICWIFSYNFQGARCGEFNGSRYCQALRQMDNHKPHHARRIILNHVKVSWFHLEAPLVPLIQARRLKRNLSPGDYTLFSVTRELTLILRQNRGWIYYKKN